MSEGTRIRVLTVDDHVLLREGIATIINNQPDMEIAGQAASGNEAIEIFRALKPDVTLMDLSLPGLTGIEAIIAILNEFPGARFIVLTTFTGDVDIRRALEAGAYSYLLKSMHPEHMLKTIRQVHSGKKYIPPEIAAGLAEHFDQEKLSNREVDVLRQVAEGNRNRDIAERLFIAEETVKVHVKHIMEKLGANDRTHATAIAARRGIIRL